MDIFNNGAFKLAPMLVLAGALMACQPRQEMTPDSAQIEAVAMAASHNRDANAELRLSAWAAQGLPVAERELALLYRDRLRQRDRAMALFEKAARAGDGEAAFELGELYRKQVVGMAPRPALAWPWYKRAAEKKHAKAALMLGLLAKNGEGVARDDIEAAKWLSVASELGEQHAMFLLYNAYKDGLGVPQDLAKARQLLEESADRDYPPALQELAMTVQSGDALTPKDEARAGHLLKEANEHRHNNWNSF